MQIERRSFHTAWVIRCISIQRPDRPLSVVAPTGDKILAPGNSPALPVEGGMHLDHPSKFAI